MDDVGLLLILGAIIIFRCCMDWIELRQELRDMRRDEEEEQVKDDGTGAASEN